MLIFVVLNRRKFCEAALYHRVVSFKTAKFRANKFILSEM